MAKSILANIRFFSQTITKNKDQNEESYLDSNPLPQDQNENKIQAHGCHCCIIPKRIIISILVSLGFLIAFGARCNMGVAITQMRSNMTSTGVPDITWSDDTLGIVYSSFFWGYAITQIPGGLLANRFPAHRVFGSVIAVSACLNLLVPWGSRQHPAAVIILRVMQGLAEGAIYPASHGIWRHWAPPLERSRLATFAFAGSYGGAVLGMPVSAYLTETMGWSSPFYFYGACGIIWYIVWCYLAYEKPGIHPTISESERNYIQECIGSATHIESPSFSKMPWMTFLTSMPVWAIIIANMARSWTLFMSIISQPTYFREVFNYNITESGLLSALPHLVMTIIVPIGGCLADYLRTNSIMSITNIRKVFNCGGFGLEALFLLVVAFTRESITATICLTLAVGFSGFAISGFNVNHLDIAPQYAPILMGLGNGCATLFALFCPVMVEGITKEGTAAEWQIVFVICSGVHLFGVLFYAIFASGEIQPWADQQPNSKQNKKDTDVNGNSQPTPV